jgi:glycosyltransferase involved in cell wall biosynthesis
VELRVAVDASALASPGNGIARYLSCTLREAVESEDLVVAWLLYGRHGLEIAARNMSLRGVERIRTDAWPLDAGRVLGLATSLPLWSARDRPDVFWGPAHRLPSWLPRATARVVTIHDLCWHEAPSTMRRSGRWLDALLMPAAWKAADRIIAVSQATADDLAAVAPETRHRIAVIPLAGYRSPSPLGIDTLARIGVGPRFVLFVGTVEPRKNLDRLLQGFARGVRDTTQLVIAGAGGWGTDALQKSIEQLGIGDRVRRLGSVDEGVLATLYEHAICLAMPSLYEGFGLPLVEAMERGTPVITSNVASMPEVAGDGGLLVNPRDVDSIASALERVTMDAALRERLSRNARLQASRFCWQRTARDTLRVLAEAYTERQRRS